VVFLKVTRAGSPARDLNTTGMWSCAQQNFDVLVEQALFIPSPSEGLPVRWYWTAITSCDWEDLSDLRFHFGKSNLRWASPFGAHALGAALFTVFVKGAGFS
jgi:hypothetical protein